MAASSLVTNQSSVAKPKQTKGQFIIAPGVNGTNARIEKKNGWGGGQLLKKCLNFKI